MSNLLRQLQQSLYELIPLTKQMGVTVSAYDDLCLMLRAPLAANVNNNAFAFAGSLNALVTLAGWGQLWLILREANLEASLLLQTSTINYLKPVTQDFVARCYKPTPATVANLLDTLRRRGRARLELRAEICQEEQIAVNFHGRYVASLVRRSNRDR